MVKVKQETDGKTRVTLHTDVNDIDRAGVIRQKHGAEITAEEYLEAVFTKGEEGFVLEYTEDLIIPGEPWNFTFIGHKTNNLVEILANADLTFGGESFFLY